MGIKIATEKISEITELMGGYDTCEICLGTEECFKMNDVSERKEHSCLICDECLSEVPDFLKWFAVNVIESEVNVFSTQCAQYKNKLTGLSELVLYFKKEFL
jgi:hypothetical protein